MAIVRTDFVNVGDATVTGTEMESLWVRLKAGDRLRPRDALLLRRLGLPPFAGGAVYETDARGYVVGVGPPEKTTRFDPAMLISTFEARFGVPHSSSGDFRRLAPDGKERRRT